MTGHDRDSAVRSLTQLDVVFCLLPIGLFVSILTLV